MEQEIDEAIAIPIDGILDLHTFLPKEIGALIPAYLESCRELEILEVRIIHGKGRGVLRRTVHSLLGRLDLVASFRPAGEEEGGWGTTLVALKWKRSAFPP
jgi:DNA-nicking Smr family endonuclease